MMTNPDGFNSVLAILLICSNTIIVIEGKSGYIPSKHKAALVPGQGYNPSRSVDIIERWCAVVTNYKLSQTNTLAADLPDLVTIDCPNRLPIRVDKKEIVEMDLMIKEDLAIHPDYPEGSLRLYRNGTPDTNQSWSSGIVQVYYLGTWGNICDDFQFAPPAADVICHQLGYSGASSNSNTGNNKKLDIHVITKSLSSANRPFDNYYKCACNYHKCASV